MASELLHTKCRNTTYPPTTNVTRYNVPDDMVSWTSAYEAYTPLQYTAPNVFTAPWADPDIL